ncbi:MAG: hypothetical protein ABEJ74_00440 [Haloferacaceae archaeon]
MSSPDDDEEWQFSLDEVGEDATTDVVERAPLEPESISLENVAFVLLGVLLALGILFVTVF